MGRDPLINHVRHTVYEAHYYTAYPVTISFGRDAILNINQEANWQLFKQRKQALINKGKTKLPQAITCLSHRRSSLIKERVGFTKTHI